jgi:hypothetical protein
MVQRGEKYGNGEKVSFFFPHKFFTSFSVTSRKKKLDQGGKYYIVSPQAHIKEAV